MPSHFVIVKQQIHNHNKDLQRIHYVTIGCPTGFPIGFPYRIFQFSHGSAAMLASTLATWIIRLNQVQDQDPCAPDVVHIIMSQIIPSLGSGSRAQPDLAYYQVAD